MYTKSGILGKCCLNVKLEQLLGTKVSRSLTSQADTLLTHTRSWGKETHSGTGYSGRSPRGRSGPQASSQQNK